MFDLLKCCLGLSSLVVMKMIRQNYSLLTLIQAYDDFSPASFDAKH